MWRVNLAYRLNVGKDQGIKIKTIFLEIRENTLDSSTLNKLMKIFDKWRVTPEIYSTIEVNESFLREKSEI